MRRVLIVLGIVLASIAGTAPAWAASSTATTPPPSSLLPGSTTPFSPGLPQSQTPTPTAATPTIIPPGSTSGSSNSGLSGTGIVLIVIGALGLLVGIAFFIWRDARRRAPVKHGQRTLMDDPNRRSKPGSKRPQKARKLSAQERRRRRRGRAR